MKIFAIKNKIKIYGYLFTDKEDYYIELVKGLDDYPIFFDIFVRKNKYIIESYWTKKWINERIIPADRQNIKDILRDNNMPYYDELLMLEGSKAHSSMDDNFIDDVRYDDIDESIKERRKHLIKDFIYLKEENKTIIFFENGESRIFSLKAKNEPFISSFGSELIVTSTEFYSYDDLYNNGENCILKYNDLLNYINKNVLSTAQISNEYNFSRQYINKLKKENRIHELNDNLYSYNNLKTFKNKQ